MRRDIEEDIGACGVDEDIIRVREETGRKNKLTIHLHRKGKLNGPEKS